MRRARRDGFTLLELLVVVSIVMLLAAILLPVFAQTRNAAHQVTCLSNLRQLALAHRLYVQDYDDALPSWYRRDPDGQVLWPAFLALYYRDSRLLEDVPTTKTVQGDAMWLADYAMCAWGAGGKGTPEEPYWRWPGAPWVDAQGTRPMSLAEVQRPAETVQFADGSTLRRGKHYSESSMEYRHGGSALNAAFLDGHARRITEAQWGQVDRDERGYFYHLATADR